MVSDIFIDPVLGDISQEFSIELAVIDTKKEPELGGSGNRRLENAGIRSVVNLGPAMVRSGFLKEGVIGRDGSERQTRATVLERSVFFTMIITEVVDSQQILSGTISMSGCRILRKVLRMRG
jgi:hypothetical protein